MRYCASVDDDDLHRPLSLKTKGIWVAVALILAGLAIVYDGLYSR